MFALECLSVVPIDFKDGVNDLDVGVNESIFFSNDTNECPKMLLNVD